MRGSLLICAAILIPTALARGQEPDPPKARAVRKGDLPKEEASLKKGDAVTLLVDKPLRDRAKRRGIRSLFVIASRTLEPYKELDAFVGSRGHLVAETSSFPLPSGTLVVPIPDHSSAVVEEVRPPDGVLNDTMAVRVRVIEGRWKGQEFWVRRSRMVLRTRARAPAAGPDSLLRQARSLEALGQAQQAAGFYGRIVADHPGTPEARQAADRIAAIGPAPAAKPARPAVKRTPGPLADAPARPRDGRVGK